MTSSPTGNRWETKLKSKPCTLTDSEKEEELEETTTACLISSQFLDEMEIAPTFHGLKAWSQSEGGWLRRRWGASCHEPIPIKLTKRFSKWYLHRMNDLSSQDLENQKLKDTLWLLTFVCPTPADTHYPFETNSLRMTLRPVWWAAILRAVRLRGIGEYGVWRVDRVTVPYFP